jgi:PTS system nitrogen regulatory IIA component
MNMQLTELFPAERVLVNLEVDNREALLRVLSETAAEQGLVERGTCLEALNAREDLGSTGLGHGIALPHSRLNGLTQVAGIIATLARPIDFEAADHEPVDIAFMVLLPEHSGAEQMKVLSQVARVARDSDVVDALRQATSPAEVLEILSEVDELGS